MLWDGWREGEREGGEEGGKGWRGNGGRGERKDVVELRGYHCWQPRAVYLIVNKATCVDRVPGRFSMAPRGQEQKHMET